MTTLAHFYYLKKRTFPADNIYYILNYVGTYLPIPIENQLTLYHTHICLSMPNTVDLKKKYSLYCISFKTSYNFNPFPTLYVPHCIYRVEEKNSNTYLIHYKNM